MRLSRPPRTDRAPSIDKHGMDPSCFRPRWMADKIGLTNVSWELFNDDGSLARGTSVLDEEPEAG